jgi:ATP/maltotriose-dependent transcriptional regulator MalT
MEWRARVHRARILSSATDVAIDEVEQTVERAIEVFDEVGDEWGLARAWELRGWLLWNSGRAGAGREAATQAASHAASAGDAVEEMWCLTAAASYAATGPAPVEEALRLSREALERAKGQPVIETYLHVTRGALEGMRGNIETARAAIAQARKRIEDSGDAFAHQSLTRESATVERYAGNLEGVERELRLGYESLRRVGAQAHLATRAAELARALVDLGRDDEAFELTRESEDLAPPDDITAQVPWRGARARILARRGAGEEAERLAREAVIIAERTDWLNLRGDSLMDLAAVLRVSGRLEEAGKAAREAVAIFERKGNAAAASRARAVVDELTTPSAR